ncbi:hypothetical protein AB0442_02115 [Kitasatospora sp. NPDC085895]|uniref:hypothetical protein n=1 Tax=Kitasatospora sp. NPDC085895 TaxID=3155057 RepID=UPI00344E4849
MTPTTSDQIRAAGTLLALLTAFADLPAADICLRQPDPSADTGWGVRVDIHAGLAHFEQWREALAVPTETIDHRETTHLAWLRTTAEFAGVPVELIGYYTPNREAEQ